MSGRKSKDSQRDIDNKSEIQCKGYQKDISNMSGRRSKDFQRDIDNRSEI